MNTLGCFSERLFETLVLEDRDSTGSYELRDEAISDFVDTSLLRRDLKFVKKNFGEEAVRTIFKRVGKVLGGIGYKKIEGGYKFNPFN
tara:strand:+ start:71 stop:334 length:264 start_codon:yes stop_codon:yes gene_type:complete